jgi:PhnB protein
MLPNSNGDIHHTCSLIFRYAVPWVAIASACFISLLLRLPVPFHTESLAASARALFQKLFTYGIICRKTPFLCRTATFLKKKNTLIFTKSTQALTSKTGNMNATHSIQLDIYINYPGHCEKAFRFYEEHLGGKINMMVPHREKPPGFPEEWKKPILHAIIEIGGTLVRGSDIPDAQPMRSAYLTLRFDSAEKAEEIYHLLSRGGEVFMKMEKTFFADRFAMLRDQFGTSWMLLYQKQE